MDKGYYIRPGTEYTVKTTRRDSDDFGRRGEVDTEELGSVQERIARLKAADNDAHSDWNTSLTRRKRTKSQEMLDQVDKLQDRHNESQSRHISMSQSSRTSSTSSADEDVMLPSQPSGQSNSHVLHKEPEFVTSTVLDLAQDEDQTDRFYETNNAANRLLLQIDVAGDDLQQNDPKFQYTRTDHYVHPSGNESYMSSGLYKNNNMTITINSTDNITYNSTDNMTFNSTNSTNTATTNFQLNSRPGAEISSSSIHVGAQKQHLSSSARSMPSSSSSDDTETDKPILLDKTKHVSERLVYTAETQSSSASDEEVEIQPPVQPVQIQPVQRIKLKTSDDERDLTAQTEMKLTGYTTGFTEGETTQDELDDEILESSIFIYKGDCKTWRVGPELNGKQCWMNSDAVEDYEDFIKNERVCATFHIWYEHNKYGWSKTALFRIREYSGVSGVTVCVNGTFSSQWKSNVIPGIYDKLQDSTGQTYYKRTAYARGRPNLPGVVDGEKVDNNVLRPNLKYVCAATIDVKKGYYGSNEKLAVNPVSEPVYVRPVRGESVGETRTVMDETPTFAQESFTQEKDILYSTMERDGAGNETECFLYKHTGVWKIGPNHNSARAHVFTSEADFDQISGADWFEVLRDTKKSKKVNPINIEVKRHSFKSDIVFLEANELSSRNSFQINGAYKQLPGLDVWQLVKSVYLNGKFQTEWKQDALTGWYDQITEQIYLRRTLTHRDQQKVHIYLFGRRWHIGPNPLSKICWMFSSKTERDCDEYVRWFEPVRQTKTKDKWVRNRTVTVSKIK